MTEGDLDLVAIWDLVAMAYDADVAQSVVEALLDGEGRKPGESLEKFITRLAERYRKRERTWRWKHPPNAMKWDDQYTVSDHDMEQQIAAREVLERLDPRLVAEALGGRRLTRQRRHDLRRKYKSDREVA